MMKDKNPWTLNFDPHVLALDPGDPTVVVPRRVQVGIVEVEGIEVPCTAITLSGLTWAQLSENREHTAEDWQACATIVETPMNISQIAAHMMASVFSPYISPEQSARLIGLFFVQLMNCVATLMVDREDLDDAQT